MILSFCLHFDLFYARMPPFSQFHLLVLFFEMKQMKDEKVMVKQMQLFVAGMNTLFVGLLRDLTSRYDQGFLHLSPPHHLYYSQQVLCLHH